MKLNKLIAAASAIAMLGGLSTVPALADDPLGEDSVSFEAHDFIVDGTTYSLSENNAVKFTVPADASTVYQNSILIDADPDIKYQMTLYNEVETAATDTNNGLYLRIRNTNQNATSNLLKRTDIGTGRLVINNIILSDSQSQINLGVFNRGFGNGSINYVGWELSETGYKVTAEEGYTILSGVDDNGYANKGGEVIYSVNDNIYGIIINGKTTINNSTVGRAPVAYNSNKEIYYIDFRTAISDANENDTIELCSDINLSSPRLTISKNLTITSNNNETITGADVSPAGILVNSGRTVTFDGVNISGSASRVIAVAQANSNLIIKNATVTGNVYQENGENTKIILDNVRLNGIVEARKGVQSTAGSTSCAITLQNGTTANGVTYYSTIDTLIIDSTSNGGTITDSNPSVPDTYNTGYFEFRVSSAISATYKTVSIDTNNGIGTADLPTEITLDPNAMGVFYIQITDVPSDTVINSITLN